MRLRLYMTKWTIEYCTAFLYHHIFTFWLLYLRKRMKFCIDISSYVYFFARWAFSEFSNLSSLCSRISYASKVSSLPKNLNWFFYKSHHYCLLFTQHDNSICVYSISSGLTIFESFVPDLQYLLSRFQVLETQLVIPHDIYQLCLLPWKCLC